MGFKVESFTKQEKKLYIQKHDKIPCFIHIKVTYLLRSWKGSDSHIHSLMKQVLEARGVLQLNPSLHSQTRQKVEPLVETGPFTVFTQFVLIGLLKPGSLLGRLLTPGVQEGWVEPGCGLLQAPQQPSICIKFTDRQDVIGDCVKISCPGHAEHRGEVVLN